MTRNLAFLTLSITTMALTACGPAPLKAPIPGREDTASIQAPVSDFTFTSGTWRDDLGNSWSASVTGPPDGSQTVTAQNTTGPGTGLVLLGDVIGGVLNYRIATPDGTALATGKAYMINGNHAFFETVNADGTPNADGVLHINHAPPAQMLPPCEALPATPGLDGSPPSAPLEPSKPLPPVPGPEIAPATPEAPRDLRPAQPTP